MEYARGHGLGGKATKLTGLFPLVSAQQIHNALQGKVKLLSDSARHAQAVLTSAERSALATWIEACAINKNAAKDEHISAQVVLMLKARRIDNQQRKHGRGTIPLTERETRLVTVANAHVSHTWLTHFNAEFPHLQRKGERNADSARTKKQNEGVVTKHFYGEFGIVASLESIGNLNMDTKMVKDARRVWWLDEMGQFLDYAGHGPRSKAWGVVGETLERSTTVNRETASMGICFCLDGFLCGPQINVARKHWTTELADAMAVPEGGRKFDSQIYLLDKKSTYAYMTKTANGVQTAESFLGWLRNIRIQILAYSEAEVKAGRTAIEFPCFIGTDNHSSRYSVEVLEVCSSIAERDLGLRLYMEEAKTSQFLQPPRRPPPPSACHRRPRPRSRPAPPPPRAPRRARSPTVPTPQLAPPPRPRPRTASPIRPLLSSPLQRPSIHPPVPPARSMPRRLHAGQPRRSAPVPVLGALPEQF